MAVVDGEDEKEKDSREDGGVCGVWASYVECYADFLAEVGRICAVYRWTTLAITACVCVGGFALFVLTFSQEVRSRPYFAAL